MITIKEVKTYSQRRAFVNFPLKLYKNNPYFVPPLYGDELKMFKKNYHYNLSSKSLFLLAYRGKEVVGRLQGILQEASNEKSKKKEVRFTRFDSINDEEVSHALFSALFHWAKQQGMEEVVGPLGYNDMEREGLLIEGFEELSTFEEQYNYEYYASLIEKEGFVKDVDWVERRLLPIEQIDPQIERVVKHAMKKGYHFVTFKTTKELIEKYGNAFFDAVDESYDELYETVPLLPEQRKELIKQFKTLLSPFYVRFLVDKDEKLVAFGVCFPAIGEFLQKSGGRLTPLTLYRIMKECKNPHALDLGLIGVTKEYMNSGIAWAMFYDLMCILNSGKIAYCETNLNLESNKAIISCWERFPHRLHKRRRSYRLKLVD